MPTYLLLTTLSAQGKRTLSATPERVFEVNREIEALGATVVKQWALLGDHDFLSVIEAPNLMVVSRVAGELAARGSASIETLQAIGIDEFLAGLEPTPVS